MFGFFDMFNKTLSYVIVICAYNDKSNVLAHPTRGMQDPRILLIASVFVTSNNYYLICCIAKTKSTID